ncbi:hypothetical protein J2S74_005441 [Evansella vedderi]|uniref:Uncharacterized protein n=1 Tax=Evansella vedderi TaxID=38282 RepID=A0ABU0A5J8_9BACI|nr:SEC-C metal-binding domain-containing protein [Evansella vedderi]MDQ0257978.1 hypothetical protein [Evansella vedderi]
MSVKVDPEVEKAMMNAMAGLKDLRKKQEEDQDKKHWSPIRVPFQLQEGLNQRTKQELDEIRRKLALKGVSMLKKADLIDLLVETLPHHLEKICLQLDNGRFSLLSSIGNNGGHMKAPAMERHQIEFFRKMGLIFTGTLDGKKIVAVPEELMNKIASLQNDPKVKAAVRRNTEWITLTHGLLYYYGTLSSSHLIEMVESYTKETVNFGEFYQVIETANAFYKGVSIDEVGFSHVRVFDPERVKQEHEKRSNIPYYAFSKDQLLKAGVPEFVDRNKSYLELVQFLTTNFEISKSDADRFVEECVYATKIGESPNNIMNYLAGILEFPNVEVVQSLGDKVIQLMNNTREWFLKGHTSTELMVEERKHLRPLPGSKMKPSNKRDRKVGRNEPCLCGSGKKYKKCCGR